jgi:uncharacterized membrane protein SpoIIM required for sporulation
MNLDEFVAARQARWARLEALLTRAGRALRQMTEAEVNDLGALYRATTGDLAVAQRDFPGQRMTIYLNQLVARAHALIYRDEPVHWRRLWRFYAVTFPQLYRQVAPYTIVAFLLLMVPALAAFLVVWSQPEAIHVIHGPGIRELVREVEAGKLWLDIEPARRSAAAATILTNNIGVMFMAFGGGILLGLFTIYIMVLNGLHLGSIFGLLQVHGLTAGLGEFVLAHGPIELSVIFLAGGCGLYLGHGIVDPGLLTRREAIVRRARLMVQIILGCAPLLVVAGLIEGFISPSGLHWGIKLAVGLATGLALHAYWLLTARRVPTP